MIKTAAERGDASGAAAAAAAPALKYFSRIDATPIEVVPHGQSQCPHWAGDAEAPSEAQPTRTDRPPKN